MDSQYSGLSTRRPLRPPIAVTPLQVVKEGGASGSAIRDEDLTARAEELVKRIEERIVDIFTSRSKLTNQKIKRNWDRKDWWIDADECLRMGLVDEVRAIMPEHHVGAQKK